MTKVGVILSGCGVEDGSEIYEAVLTMLALERLGASVQAIAPDVEQANVINHYTGQETRLETRNVMTESARIVRGKIMAANEISSHDLDALILVGGFGVAKNLSTYASDAANATVNPDIARLIVEMNGLAKPIGASGSASLLVALALSGKSPVLTGGGDGAFAADLMRLGAHHSHTLVDQACVDEGNSVVSTSGMLLAQSPLEAETGINKLVGEVLRMARALGPGHGADSTALTTYAPLDAGLNTPNASL